ncbi:MAG: HK97 gp10 family phage protein [Pseudodesulfovibrio sp.]|uniref:HK97 gp10 family phage protein n=1 Tax=Pseudodesulfovibrio sp. TaxID=2035812 RepID=UPI003D0EC131
MADRSTVLDTLTDGLFVAIAKSKRVAVEAVDRAGKFAVVEAKKRAPIDKGKLEESITHDTDREQDGSVTTTIRIKQNRKSRKYAVKMHESHYNLGPRSQEKNDTGSVVVGRKYLERAITENEDELLKILAAEIRKELS